MSKHIYGYIILLPITYILGIGTHMLYTHEVSERLNMSSQRSIENSLDSTLVGDYLDLDDDLYVIKTLASQVDSVQAMYIEKYAYIAVNEQTKYGFPASVKLAQFLLEGGFSIQNPEGSELVTQNQNPFGIRYFGDNVPSRINDWHNLAFSKNWIKLYSDCKITHCEYVKFKSIWHSFRYHSLFMVGTPNNPSHYVGYINDGTWVDWLNALEKGGYATSDAYRYTLRNIIIRYKLYLLDKHKIYI